MRCLIISTNALGDTYLSCSAIESLRINFPEIQIDIIANKAAELFIPYLNLDNIFYLRSKKISEIRSLLREIKNIKYDYTFCFFPGLVNTFFFLNARSKVKSGFINYIKRNEWYNKTDKLTVKGIRSENKTWTPEMNYLERIKISLNAVGISTGKIIKPKFNFPTDYTKSNHIILHPFSRSGERKIDGKKLVEIIDFINEKKDIPVKVICSRQDEIGELKDLNLLCDLSIKELVQQLVSSKLYVGVDSFPLHIADAYNVNLLGIFSVTHPDSVFQKKKDHMLLNSSSIEIASKILEKL